MKKKYTNYFYNKEIFRGKKNIKKSRWLRDPELKKLLDKRDHKGISEVFTLGSFDTCNNDTYNFKRSQNHYYWYPYYNKA